MGQVFALLVMEMSVFLLLVFPLPFTWRKKVFEFISNNPVIAKLQYGMKVCSLPTPLHSCTKLNHVCVLPTRLPSFSY